MKNLLKKNVLTACAFLLLFNNGLANINAQSFTLSITLEKQPLSVFFDKIESMTDYHFFYRNSNLNTEQSVSINFQDKDLEYILKNTLKSSDINYKIVRKRIILNPRKNKKIINNISEQQLVTITGTVYDELEEPLLGAVVLLKGTTNGVQTDIDGNFSIQITEQDSILEISYLGYKVKEVVIKDALEALKIVLEQDVSELDDVVVVGYGTQAKKEVTGAIAVIDSKVISELNPTRVEQALQGQVAGVNITSSSGAPGSDLNIRIRGVSTNGDNRPLILIDGNVVESLNVINPNNIANISVIKDATAAIYGARAANGVILITTKTASKEAPLMINYNMNTGVQEVSRKIPVLNARQYAAIINESYIADGQQPPFEDINNLPNDTDWQDQVLNLAFTQQHNLSVSGGLKKLTYVVDGSFMSQDGIIGGEKANFKRYTGRLSLNYDILDNLTVNTVSNFTSLNTKSLPQNSLGSPLFNALNLPPTLAVRDADGNYTLPEDGLGNEIVNPLQQIDNTFNGAVTSKFNGSYGLKYKFLEHFSIEGRYQFNYAKVNSNNFYPAVNYGSGKSFNRVESDDRYQEVYEIFNDYTIKGLLRYENTFKENHTLNVLLGYETFKTEKIRHFQRVGIDLPEGVDYGSAKVENAQTISELNIPLWENKLLSYFTRVQYDYKKKYLFTGTIRRDGSSIFGPDNRIGYFPSASLGWVVSEESFLKSNAVIDFFKLRVSYGIIGNDRIAESGGTYRSNIKNLNVGRYAFGQNTIQQGSGIGVLGNPKIKWEEQESFNIGLDMTFLKDKFNLTLDYFNKMTRDLLATPQVSGILGSTAPGSGAPIVNAGSLKNNGIEVSLGYNQYITKESSFSLRTNFTAFRNKVLSINDEKGFVAGGSFGVGQDPPSRMEAGMPIGYFYGYKTEGVYQKQATADEQLYNRPGELKYKDINGDDEITIEDKTNIGNPLPDWTMGFNLSFNYKNFDLQSYAFASYGNDIVRNYERSQPKVNRLNYTLNRWTGEGSTNQYPYVTVGNTLTRVFSDFYVEDGSFFKIQNIQIGYTFSEKILKKIYVNKLRIYASVNNIFTFTKYKGYDPSFSSGEPIGGGIDAGFYPPARTYLFGINLTL